jgi:hypothetical protein
VAVASPTLRTSTGNYLYDGGHAGDRSHDVRPGAVVVVDGAESPVGEHAAGHHEQGDRLELEDEHGRPGGVVGDKASNQRARGETARQDDRRDPGSVPHTLALQHGRNGRRTHRKADAGRDAGEEPAHAQEDRAIGDDEDHRAEEGDAGPHQQADPPPNRFRKGITPQRLSSTPAGSTAKSRLITEGGNPISSCHNG